jgi:hypothetical protein
LVGFVLFYAALGRNKNILPQEKTQHPKKVLTGYWLASFLF